MDTVLKVAFKFGVGLCAGLFSVSTLLALDLTPHFEDYEYDGVPVHKLVFLDGKKKVYLEPPKTWTAEGGAAQVTLQPGANSHCKVQLSLGDATANSFDENTVNACRRRVQGMLLDGAKDFSILKETDSPYIIYGWKSYQIIGQYNHYGSRVKIGVTFINLDDKQQLIVMVTGPESEFDPVAAGTKSTLMSWFKP